MKHIVLPEELRKDDTLIFDEVSSDPFHVEDTFSAGEKNRQIKELDK